MAYLLLVLTVLFWAGNFVLARSLVDILPPFTMASLRWSLAFILLLPFVYKPLMREKALLFKHWKIISVLSLFGVALFNCLIYLGVQKTTATNAALLQSAIPIMVLLLCMVFYKEWLSKKQFLGVLFSCFGVIVIITKGQVAALLDLQLNSGDVWILAAVMSWTSYSILLRYKPLEISGLSLLAANIFIGNLIIYPFVYWELQHTQIKAFDVSSEIVISVFYLAIFPSLLAYLFWNKAVSQIGAAKASLFIHLLPVFGTILASIFLSEQLKVFHLIGIVLIFMGIYLAVITDIMQRIKLAKSNKYQ